MKLNLELYELNKKTIEHLVFHVCFILTFRRQEGRWYNENFHTNLGTVLQAFEMIQESGALGPDPEISSLYQQSQALYPYTRI
jgi:hypothetical protein